MKQRCPSHPHSDHPHSDHPHSDHSHPYHPHSDHPHPYHPHQSESFQTHKKESWIQLRKFLQQLLILIHNNAFYIFGGYTSNVLIEYESRTIPKNCNFPKKYSFKTIPEDLDLISTSLSNFYHFLEEIKRHFYRVCRHYGVSSNLYNIEVVKKKIHIDSVVFYQAHYETPFWNFRLDILCQPLKDLIPPPLITDRNDLINNACYLFGYNNHIKATFPLTLSKYYSNQNQRLEFIRYLHHNLYLVPYCQEDWLNIPIVSPVFALECSLEKIWDAINLWKRLAKYHERGYQFYPKAIPGFYDPSKFKHSHYRKTTTPSPICAGCQKKCSHYGFHLTENNVSHVYHIGCLVKMIKIHASQLTY